MAPGKACDPESPGFRRGLFGGSPVPGVRVETSGLHARKASASCVALLGRPPAHESPPSRRAINTQLSTQRPKAAPRAPPTCLPRLGTTPRRAAAGRRSAAATVARRASHRPAGRTLAATTPGQACRGLCFAPAHPFGPAAAYGEARLEGEPSPGWSQLGCDHDGPSLPGAVLRAGASLRACGGLRRGSPGGRAIARLVAPWLRPRRAKPAGAMDGPAGAKFSTRPRARGRRSRRTAPCRWAGSESAGSRPLHRRPPRPGRDTAA